MTAQDINAAKMAGKQVDKLLGVPIVIGQPKEPDPNDVPVDVYEEMAKRDGTFEGKEELIETDMAMKPAILAAMTAIHERWERGVGLAGMSTGYWQLDKALDGLQLGRTYVIGARSGHGKTIFSINLSINVASQRHPVLYFSMEMPRNQVVTWSLFSQSGVSSNRLKIHKLRREDWAELTVAAARLSEMPFRWDDTCGLTIEEIEERIAKRTTHRPPGTEPVKLVVIDHALLIRATNQRAPRREQMIHITKTIKEIAKRRNVAMVALDQISRALESRSVKDKRPQISDLKESGSFEEDNDAVLLLYRADKYERDRNKHTHEMEVIMPKIRDGQESYAKLRFTGDCYRVDNLEEGDAPSDVQDDELPVGYTPPPRHWQESQEERR